METLSQSTRDGGSENRAISLGYRFFAPVPLLRTRESLRTGKERQSRPHWRNVRVEFQVRMAQRQSLEFPTKRLRQRSRVSASTSAGSKYALRSRHLPKTSYRVVR